MWTTVKSSYPDMTVCEIGATIGRLWRELTNEQKEKYNEDFMRDKVAKWFAFVICLSLVMLNIVGTQSSKLEYIIRISCIGLLCKIALLR
jgi:hypothetical protein